MPTLDALADLAAEARLAGADVAVDAGPLPPLDPGLQLCAYRVVQEALTNAAKHARQPRVRVRLSAEDGDLVVAVDDDGGSGPRSSEGTGHGLVGLRERVEVYGGSLESQSRAGRRLPGASRAAHRGPHDRRCDGPTTVVVVDDEELFRSGLRMVIETRPGIEVVGEAGNGAEAVAVVRQRRPDVVLMDVQMPRLNGIDATRRIVALGLPTRVLMLTTFGMDKYVVESLRAGASGFLLKTVPPDQLAAGIATVARGDALLAPAILRRLIEDWTTQQPLDGQDPRLASLTEREAEVLRLVGTGLSNNELAGRLHLAEATVKTHVGRILTKTGCRDRVQAVVLAYETGVVRPGG